MTPNVHKGKCIRILLSCLLLFCMYVCVLCKRCLYVLSSWRSQESFQSLSLSFTLDPGIELRPSTLCDKHLVAELPLPSCTGLNLKLSHSQAPGRTQLKGFPHEEPLACVWLACLPACLLFLFFFPLAWKSLSLTLFFIAMLESMGNHKNEGFHCTPSSNCSGSKETPQN